ncbi:hypothetical protein GKZ68_20955 (plasmid) [Hymenobacter sp. BRD128]|uniref:hypothetical protein n=1 Tax=Hymenobacter sp. BRD128 TaxID=2675878 RepID=UPI00156301D5|nr:hypothetical protein [Hymenobacter sp. BRD128]QKG59152.1 hypothetical protein GKZ68_20955 [Hymenobacter sp. BRD128]
MNTTLLNPLTTITLAQAQRQATAQRLSYRAAQRARLVAFQEFRESYCDLFDAADWLHYQETTGLHLATLLRFARYQCVEQPRQTRLFVRPPQSEWFEPYHMRRGYVEADYAATVATPRLLDYLRQRNPDFTIVAAPDWQSANAGAAPAWQQAA